MAVDYSKYRNSSTYKSNKNIYNQTLTNARNADAELDKQKDKSTAQVLNSSLSTVAGVVAGMYSGWNPGMMTFAYTATDALLNGLASSIIDGKTIDRPENIQNRVTVASQLMMARNDAVDEANGYRGARNENITNLKLLTNSTRNSFNDTYGAGSFDKLEGLVNNLLNMPNDTVLSRVIAGLQTDAVTGVVTSRLTTTEYGDGLFTDGQIDELYSRNISLSEFGGAYVDYLNEFLMSNSEYGSKYNELAQQMLDANEDFGTNLEEIQNQNIQAFANAFLDARQTNIGGAEALGSVQSREASSGIKASGRTASASIVQRFKNDLAKATYVTLLNQREKQLQLQYKNLETTRDRTFRQAYNAQVSLERQMKENVTSSMNDWIHGSAKGMKENVSLTAKEDKTTAESLALNDEISSIFEEFTDEQRKTFNDNGYNITNAFMETV